MAKKGSTILQMRKLDNKDIQFARELKKQGYRIKEICERFGVSNGYLYYHGIRKWEF